MLADAEMRALCHRAVTLIAEDNDWRLLTEDEYFNRVYAEAVSQRAETEQHCRRIAQMVYSLAMFEACQPARAQDGTARYERGHLELHAFVTRCVYGQRPDWPREDIQEAAQSASAKILQALQDGSIRKPAAFLRFAALQVRGATTAIKRGGQKGKMPIVSLDGLATTPATELLEDDAGFAAPDAAAEDQQLIEAVAREVQRKRVIHPKATQQLDAALLRLAFGRTNEQIAERLGASPKQVSSLVWRGKRKFSQNRELRVLYMQWFVDAM
jgi:DNA-directed RNA polymerase specialized sigma24 family protein